MTPINWILLRGLGRESRHWLTFPKDLARRLGGEVHCLDLPGFGTEGRKSPPLTVGATTESLRKRFLDLKEDCENDHPWACLGISLGGMVAMDWAKRYSDDFAKLVLINVSSKDVAAVHHRISLFAIYCMLRAAFSRDMEGRERQILKMISNLRSRDPLTVEKMVEIATTSDESADKIFRQIVAASQFVAPESLKPPTLFLASLKDKMVDVRCSKMIAERLAAKIKFHGTAGHDLPLDDSEWTIDRIEEFVTGNEA